MSEDKEGHRMKTLEVQRYNSRLIRECVMDIRFNQGKYILEQGFRNINLEILCMFSLNKANLLAELWQLVIQRICKTKNIPTIK